MRESTGLRVVRELTLEWCLCCDMFSGECLEAMSRLEMNIRGLLAILYQLMHHIGDICM